MVLELIDHPLPMVSLLDQMLTSTAYWSAQLGKSQMSKRHTMFSWLARAARKSTLRNVEKSDPSKFDQIS